MSMSEMDVQHIGHDIPYELPEVEVHNEKVRGIELELATEILNQFDLATRIFIVQALWGIVPPRRPRVWWRRR